MSATRKNVFLLCGLPGSGKGTQLRPLASAELACLSCGDLFRWHVNNQTPFGMKAIAHIKSGTLTPDEDTSRMFLAELGKCIDAPTVLFEGYPRTVAQMRHLNEYLADRGWTLRNAFYLNVPKDELVRRIADRMICPTCNRVYRRSQFLSAAPVCVEDASRLTVRQDDNPDIVRKRIDYYERAEAEVILELRQMSKVVEIDGTQSADAITELLKTAVLLQVATTS